MRRLLAAISFQSDILIAQLSPGDTLAVRSVCHVAQAHRTLDMTRFATWTRTFYIIGQSDHPVVEGLFSILCVEVGKKAHIPMVR
ncbi:MAG TPA: hypothetical protein VLR92_01845, partial [Blastocatellia bacterium]|nr:hypothetical protein [Blastocatellia bacterium]